MREESSLPKTTMPAPKPVSSNRRSSGRINSGVRRRQQTRQAIAAALMMLGMGFTRPACARGLDGTPPGAPQSDWTACESAALNAERSLDLPPRLLRAIGMVETARSQPISGRTAPWPWSVDVDGVGAFYATKAQAVAAVTVAQKSGAKFIDVGCMQVDISYHPHAFGNLGEAFEPEHNAAYAGALLRRLHQQTGDWLKAAAAYHSQTRDIGAAYARRVAAAWPGMPAPADSTASVPHAEAPPDPLERSAPVALEGLASVQTDQERARVTMVTLGILPASVLPLRVAAAPAMRRAAVRRFRREAQRFATLR